MWHTAKIFILESGFSVLKVIAEFQKKGVFSLELIKKCRYWKTIIKGDDVKAHFAHREVGTVDAWPGQLDGVKFLVI